MKPVIACGIAALTVAAIPDVASAQQTQQADEPLQEVIVTALKRQTDLQSVPFSIAAVTGADMRSKGVTNIVDLSRNVTGLTIADLGPGQSQIAIRGISAGQVVRDQPGVKPLVGVYLDESPVSISLFTPDLDLYDLERFEVLRGPQGTLFGSGSIGGTLRYITAQPKLGATEGSYQAGMTQLKGGEFGGNVKGALNIPVGDAAALRVVGYYNRLPGFIDAFGPGATRKTDVDGGRKAGARLALLYKPSDSLSITPRVVVQKLGTNGYPRVDAYNVLGNPYTTTQPAVTVGERGQYIQLQECLDDDFQLTDLKLEYDFGAATLTSVSSYTDREVVVLRDASQLTGSVTWDVGGTAAEVRLSSPLYDTTKLTSFAQELRVASNGEGPWQWLFGAFYEQTNKRYGQNLPTPGYDAVTQRLFNVVSSQLGAPANTPFYSDLKYDFRQIAAFGEVTYSFSDQLKLTGGARYFDFNEDRSLYFAGFFADYTPTPLPGKVSSDGISPRLILSYQLSDDVRLNAQASRGFRLGGINDPINVPLCTPADRATFGGQKNWKDELAWNYEIGAKMRLADRKVTFNVAAFYTDISGLQANTDGGSCSSRIVFNVPKASSMGIEAELFARPNDNWDFGLSATWAKAELNSSVTSTSGNVTTVVAGLRDGARLPTAPKLQAAASIGYTAPLAEGQDFFANLTGQYVGSSFTQISDEVPGFGTIGGGAFIRYGAPTVTSVSFNPELPSYQLVNLRFGLRSDQWEVAVVANNLLDERALLSLDRERGTRARVSYLTNPPRSIGFEMRRTF